MMERGIGGCEIVRTKEECIKIFIFASKIII